MTTKDNIFDLYAQAYESQKQHSMSLREYLEGCRNTPAMYASTAERMIAAIGEPEFVDTAKDARLGRIFMNRTLKVYPAFKDFYGLEETIERIVGFFRHAAQGLEEKKQILYLLGPVGGGKSSLADRLKDLMEKCPIYVLATNDGISPIFESALGLFDPATMGRMLEDRYGIPERLLMGNMSPWAVKRLDEFGGDISKFSVIKLHPSKLRQICVAKTEPGDENNQDISALVGKVDIRKLEHFGQNDADAYSYSGGLNRTTQGVLEFVEMFKAPLKMLHPLLTATQDRTYVGTENVGAMPYQGLIIAHSNESEWQSFRANKNNEAFLDRISVIKVPYCLRVAEEKKIYEKLLTSSELKEAAIAPGTLEMLARFSVLTRLKAHENSSLYSKMRVYDGESLKDTDPHAKTIQEYRDAAGVGEGMEGASTRFAYKILSETFNFDTNEVAADPVHLLYVIEQAIRREQMPEDTESRWVEFLKEELSPRYAEFIGNEIQKAYLEFLSRLRPEPVRPLRRLRRRLDRGSRLQGPRHRPVDEPPGARAGALQDREACRHRQPQGLPLRGGQVLAARPLQERRQEPELDQLREDPRGDRAAHVQPGRGSAAGNQLRQEAGQRDREEARGVRAAHGRARLHPTPGAPSRGMVHAGQEIELTSACVRGPLPCASLMRRGGSLSPPRLCRAGSAAAAT